MLYDVASAVMYLGGAELARAFLDTSRARGPLLEDEMLHLDAFRRFRWVVQGTYFAWRLAAHDLTGGIDGRTTRRVSTTPDVGWRRWAW